MAETNLYDHPYYPVLAQGWRTFRDLYEGDHATLVSPKYLVPHEKESSQEPAGGRGPDGLGWTVGEKLRHLRSSRSWYLNLFEPVVSNWVSMGFAKPIKVPKDVKDMFGDAEYADVDGQGNSLENFVKTVFAPVYFRDGRTLLLADSSTGSFRNQKEQRDAGFRPYLEVLDVLVVKDWQVGKSGAFDWLRHEYTAVAPRSGPDIKPEQEEFSRTLTLEGGKYVQRIFKRVGKVWEFDTEIPIPGWDVLPVASVLYNESWVKDVSPLQVALFNVMSGWFNVINTQGFERVIIAGALNDKHKISVSEYTWPVIPEGAVPHVIPPADLSSNESAMAWLVNQIYRVAFNQKRGLSDASKEAPGADTIQEMNVELVAVLKVALSEMQACLNRGVEYYARLKDGSKYKNFKSEITFDTDLSVEDVEKAAQRFLTYRDEIRKVPAWRKAHLKKAALAEGFTEDELEQIITDIDKLKDEPLVNPLLGMGPFMNGGRQQEQEGEEEAEGSGDAEGERPGRPGGRPGGGGGNVPA